MGGFLLENGVFSLWSSALAGEFQGAIDLLAISKCQGLRQLLLNMYCLAEANSRSASL